LNFLTGNIDFLGRTFWSKDLLNNAFLTPHFKHKTAAPTLLYKLLKERTRPEDLLKR
jgi:hypothetical protein